MAFRFYLSLFLRRLHWFVLVVVLCSGLGALVAFVWPPTYLAEARLIVESEQIPDALAASTVQTGAEEQLQIIQQRILTRDILVEMANRLDIYADRRAKGLSRLDAEEIVEDMRTRIQIAVTGSTASRRRGSAQATIVTVSFSDPTAELAARVTNELVTLILKEDVSMRTGVARQTLEFFEQEVVRLDKDLATRAAAILAFKEKNISALPDGLAFSRTQQAGAQERILQLARQEAELQDKRARMIRLRDTSSADVSTDEPRTPEAKQLRAAREERAKMLVVLSPENPKIKMIEQQIASLQKIVDSQVTGAATDAEGDPMTAFQMDLAELDGQLAYLAQEKVQVTKQLEDLDASIRATPANAVALETMERDYTALKEQYAKAIDNKARAETGDTIEALSKGQRISVIEQAIAPREPTKPNRPLIAAAGVGGGLVFGVALVGLIEFLKGGVRRPIDLTNGLGLTPFATLPYLSSPEEEKREKLMIWGALGLVVLAILGGLLILNTYFMPLDLLFARLQHQFG